MLIYIIVILQDFKFFIRLITSKMISSLMPKWPGSQSCRVQSGCLVWIDYQRASIYALQIWSFVRSILIPSCVTTFKLRIVVMYTCSYVFICESVLFSRWLFIIQTLNSYGWCVQTPQGFTFIKWCTWVSLACLNKYLILVCAKLVPFIHVSHSFTQMNT